MTSRYITGEINHCPGCWRSQWIVGRRSAQCAFCGYALPLASQPCEPKPMMKMGNGGGIVKRCFA